jgi:hypothetical protein
MDQARWRFSTIGERFYLPLEPSPETPLAEGLWVFISIVVNIDMSPLYRLQKFPQHAQVQDSGSHFRLG